MELPSELSSEYELSPAQTAEIDEIQDIARDGGLFRYPNIILKFLINRKRIYTLKKAGKLIAYFSYVVIPEVSKAYLLQIGITAAHRGKGLGSKLLELLCQKVKADHKMRTVLAHTLKPRVAKLFKRQNWRILFQALGVFFVSKKIN